MLVSALTDGVHTSTEMRNPDNQLHINEEQISYSLGIRNCSILEGRIPPLLCAVCDEKTVIPV